MSISNQRGNVLLYVITGIAMAAAIGVGMFYMLSTQSLGQAFGNETNRAYYLALAGKEYVINTWSLNGTYGYPPSSQPPFIISNTEHFYISTSNGQIISTGIVNEGTPFQASRTIIVPQ